MRKAVRITAGIVAAGTLFGLGAAAGASGAKTVTVTRTIRGAATTVTRTVTVPGPARTVLVTAPPPAAGSVLGKWSGSGNQNTPAFNAPDSGNYVVSWTYSGNVDNSLGTGTASNFIITATDQGATALGLPVVIGSSGSGSTEVTGASGTESFNVQALGQWTVSVKSAP